MAESPDQRAVAARHLRRLTFCPEVARLPGRLYRAENYDHVGEI